MARGKGEDGPHLVDRHVGRRVSERRIGLGFTQSQLGEALGLTFQQIQKYEKGTNRVSASKLWEMSRFLEVDTRYFFEGLTALAPGMTEPDAASFDHDHPVTRQSLELARLAPRLSTRPQKLVLDMIREMLKEDED